jgi:NitT/TauT family transport system ATP-binding protein
MSRIVATHVGKRYGAAEDGAGTRALSDLCLTVDDNEFLCLVGPSGCGKSTFLNLVAGFISPSEGQLTVDGQPILAPGPDRGVVFQEDALFPWLSALDNVAFGLELKGIGRKAARDRAAEALKRVGLQGFERHLPKELSGGMKQRVAISRVLANDPKVMLLDEPFSALDTFTRTSLQNQLLQIWERNKRTLLFVTHSVEEAVLLGTTVAVMAKAAEGGKLIREISIDMPRPRDTTGAEFNDYKRQILTALQMDVAL